MASSLTLFFIVEAPNYQYPACYLAASIRQCMPPDVQLVGYCPAHKMKDLDPAAIETLRRMRCEVRPMDTLGRFEPDYPHGNKMLACLEPRETDYSGFMDSDILMIRKNQVRNLVRQGHVSCSVAASMYWAPQTIWDDIYGAFDMDVPEERVTLMRDKRREVVPYFSSGFVVFPEQFRTKDGQSFPEVWMDTAQRIDLMEDLENRRPYLDQMSLPVAMRRAGLKWKELPEEQHFILGGTLRKQPFPKDRKIYTVHYRKWEVLKENGLSEIGYNGLRSEIGTRRVSNVWNQKLPAGIAPTPEGLEPSRKEAEDPAPAATGQADPSKAAMAAVTMVRDDHFFLRRWVDYYAGQVGRKNLYILRHGTDPQVDQIAEGANILHLPVEESAGDLDARRWAALGKFASGLTLYYNWVLCGDVDEIVALDPEAGSSLPNYLNAKFESGRAPVAISPMGIEMVHTPASEKDEISEDQPLLSVRRNFRLNTHMAKPCITRGRITYSAGGYGSNHRQVSLDPHLYNFHLRYIDQDISRARLQHRQMQIAQDAEGIGTVSPNAARWDLGAQEFDRISVQEPAAEQIDFPGFRKEMLASRGQTEPGGGWAFKPLISTGLYSLPERFRTLF